MFFQIARENILLLINNVHEKMIKNRMFRRRHLRTKLRLRTELRHLSIFFPCLLAFFSAYTLLVFRLLNSHTIFTSKCRKTRKKDEYLHC